MCITSSTRLTEHISVQKAFHVQRFQRLITRCSRRNFLKKDIYLRWLGIERFIWIDFVIGWMLPESDLKTAIFPPNTAFDSKMPMCIPVLRRGNLKKNES